MGLQKALRQNWTYRQTSRACVCLIPIHFSTIYVSAGFISSVLIYLFSSLSLNAKYEGHGSTECNWTCMLK